MQYYTVGVYECSSRQTDIDTIFINMILELTVYAKKKVFYFKVEGNYTSKAIFLFSNADLVMTCQCT
jgi:hypothetical protein